MPQDDDVVTPPVALGDTEHGPFGVNAGSVGAWPPDGVAPGESEPPDVPLTELELTELLFCACAGAKASPAEIARMKRRLIALSIS